MKNAFISLTMKAAFCTLVAPILATSCLAQEESSVVASATKHLTDSDTVAIVRLHVQGVNEQAFASVFAAEDKSNEVDVVVLAERIKESKRQLLSAGVNDIYLLFNLHDSNIEFPTIITDKVDDIQIIRRQLANWVSPWKVDAYTSFDLGRATVLAPKLAIPRLEALSKLANNKVSTFGNDVLFDKSHVPFRIHLRWSIDQLRVLVEQSGGSLEREVIEMIRSIDSIDVSVPFNQPLDATIVVHPTHDDAGPTFLDHSNWFARLPEGWGLNSTVAQYLSNEIKREWQLNSAGDAELQIANSSEFSRVVDTIALAWDEQEASRRLQLLSRAIWTAYEKPNHFLHIGSRLGRVQSNLGWRVHLLPFLGENALYQEFRLNENWDSPHNKSLIPRMPEVFRCPRSKLARQTGQSTFGLPANEKSMWPLDKTLTVNDVHDGTVNTIMIAELADSHAQIWTKPIDEASDISNANTWLGRRFDDRVLVCFGDTGVCLLPKETNNSQLIAFFTRSGCDEGEEVVSPESR